ncbi:ribosomal RNA-processing protein 7-domain-containing protein [Parasitella parasitica]|nr:ribosomal RNA-processing protein 7-domain-containing protein [Parasitella parasitica]
MAKVKKSSTSASKQVLENQEKTSKLLEDFQGFKVLPVIMDENKKNVRHYFYIRKHESKSLVDEDIKDRTMFMLNLPADTTDRHIKRLFKGLGIDQITYSDSGSSVSEDYWKIQAKQQQQELDAAANKKKKKHQKKQEQIEPEVRELRKLFTSGSSAHIIFSTEDDLTKALSMHRVEKKWAKDDDSVDQPLGFERYILAYDLSRPNAADLQQEVDSFMKKFKADEYQKEREKLERMNQMDDDGFTVVVRHKKTKATDGTIHVGSISAEAAEAQREHKLKQKKELVNFYRFQMREKKQNELVELRKRFEEDKAKIAQLKQSRKFKPY